ncbi:MAG: sigma-70 family RNA polymerase sigma factor [Planctomycetes bacterium]|nr:sigma-70 family RNA polymerase sigma factor [Planctomycetota bacterium]
MSTAKLAPVITFLRKAASPLAAAGDDDLLRCFARHGDDEAFAALVERHGPMVLGVCRRVLNDAHEAEDAFQATFLLLLRRAGTLRPGPLGPWLHGVAYRTALKARERAVLRRGREVTEHDRVAADPIEEIAWRDLRPLLDEAIGRLPNSYRVPFVLCYLEGRTNAEAAEALGCPRGTIATRLSRARERLRAHLSRRGLTLSAGLLSALLSREAVAREAVSAALGKSAARAACGPAGGSAPVPASVLALTKGVARTMLMDRLKVVLAVLLIAGTAGVGLLALSRRADAGPPAERRDVNPPVLVPPAVARDEEPPDSPGIHRTKNFRVSAASQRVARLVAEAAEVYRKKLALLWLGKELPPWPEPCPVKVTITARGSGGATSFAFDAGKVLNQNMHLEGPLDSILANVLPHEVTHTILAHAVGKPLPRWADEGAAVLAEDDQEHRRYDRLVTRIIDERRAMPLRRLFALNEYPRDVMTLFAQGYSVTNFLVGKNDRQTFLAFVKLGMRDGWDRAVRAYNFRDVEALEDTWLAKLRRTPPKKDDPRTVSTILSPASDAEGSRFPAGPQPLILPARWDEGKVVIRMPVTATRYREVAVPGKERDRIVYTPETVQTEQRMMIDSREVRAFGTDGKEIDAKKLARLLAKETPVLVSADGKPIDPFYLRIVKEGTLLVLIVPTSPPLVPTLSQPTPVQAVPPPTGAPLPPTEPAPVVPPPRAPAVLPPPTEGFSFFLGLFR